MATSSNLSLIIPVYNRAHIVGRTLDSVLRQNVRPAHLILIDNNSTDTTLEMLNRWKSDNDSGEMAVTIVTEAHPGASAARNRGLREVATEYVMHFDSDDVMLPGHIERIDRELKRDPSIDIIHFDMAVMQPEGWTETHSATDTDLVRGQIFHSLLSTVRFAVRTSLLRKCGGWDESLPSWNDLELGLRLLTSQPQPKSYRLSGEPTVMIYPLEESITGTSHSQRASQLERALDVMEQRLALTGHEHEKMWLNARRVILAGIYRKEGDKSNADRLLNTTLNRVTGVTALKLQAIHAVSSWMSHGASMLACILLPRPQERKKKARFPFIARPR